MRWWRILFRAQGWWGFIFFIIQIIQVGPAIAEPSGWCRILLKESRSSQSEFSLSIGTPVSLITDPKQAISNATNATNAYFIGRIKNHPDSLSGVFNHLEQKEWLYFMSNDGTIHIVPEIHSEIIQSSQQGDLLVDKNSIQNLFYVRKQNGKTCATYSTLHCLNFLFDANQLPESLKAVYVDEIYRKKLEDSLFKFVSFQDVAGWRKFFLGAEEQIQNRLKILSQYPKMNFKMTSQWELIDINLAAGNPVILDLVDDLSLVLESQTFSIPHQGRELLLKMKGSNSLGEGHSIVALKKIGEDWILIADSSLGVLKVVPSQRVKESIAHGYATIISGEKPVLEPKLSQKSSRSERGFKSETLSELKERIKKLFNPKRKPSQVDAHSDTSEWFKPKKVDFEYSQALVKKGEESLDAFLKEHGRNISPSTRFFLHEVWKNQAYAALAITNRIPNGEVVTPALEYAAEKTKNLLFDGIDKSNKEEFRVRLKALLFEYLSRYSKKAPVTSNIPGHKAFIEWCGYDYYYVLFKSIRTQLEKEGSSDFLEVYMQTLYTFVVTASRGTGPDGPLNFPPRALRYHSRLIN